jgi:uncharacterized membrane protein YphA (DoxX/SURF4 family)
VNNGYRIGFWAALTIVALRVLIGWHFMSSGIDKLEPGWTSASHLRSANGPLADFYKSYAPLPHQWDQLIDKPLPPQGAYDSARRYVGDDGELHEGPQSDDREGHIPLPTDAYGPWASRIAEDWTEDVARFKGLTGITDEQREAADTLLSEKKTRLAQYFESHRGALEEYHHELDRLNEMLQSDARGELPYLDDRILKKKAELQAMPRSLVADIESEEDMLHEQLTNLVTDEQRESAALDEPLGDALNPATPLKLVDTTVTVVTFAVGVCLILGLFTRVAAVVGAGFLLSIMSMQPPWAEGVLETVKLLTAYQGIEFIAMLLLAAVGAGTWAGLDGLFWRRDH